MQVWFLSLDNRFRHVYSLYSHVAVHLAKFVYCVAFFMLFKISIEKTHHFDPSDRKLQEAQQVCNTVMLVLLRWYMQLLQFMVLVC